MKLNLTLSLLWLLPTWLHANQLTVTVKSPDQQAVEQVIVYLEPLAGQPVPKRAHQIRIDQHDKAFAPYISVTQRGNPVLFTNRDDITHHIYSATGDNKFSFKIRAGQEKLKDDLLHSGEIAMGCNVHDWMSGYLLVVDTPYFEQSNARGEANFDIQAPGPYRLTVWHPQLNEKQNRLVRELNIKEKNSITLTLSAPMAPIPEQQSDDDFDFLSEY